VESADRGITRLYYGHNLGGSAFEIFSAKEAKRRFDCSGKHLGCLEMFVISGAGGGLQYGLSGNRATGRSGSKASVRIGNNPDAGLMGNRLFGNGR